MKQVARGPVQAYEIPAVDADTAGRRGQQARRHVEERGLAAAARSDDGDERAGLDGERDVLDRSIRAAGGRDEVAADTIELQCGHFFIRVGPHPHARRARAAALARLPTSTSPRSQPYASRAR